MCFGVKTKESSNDKGESPIFFSGGIPKVLQMAGAKSHLTLKTIVLEFAGIESKLKQTKKTYF